MSDTSPELQRRVDRALAAILASYGTPDGEYSTTLFVGHHLEELDACYWQEQLGTPTPSPQQVLGLLRLSSDSMEDGEDEEDAGDGADEEDDPPELLDFALPGGVSDYLLSVDFDQDGEVIQISMES
jgi:hypothetical protein